MQERGADRFAFRRGRRRHLHQERQGQGGPRPRHSVREHHRRRLHRLPRPRRFRRRQRNVGRREERDGLQLHLLGHRRGPALQVDARPRRRGGEHPHREHRHEQHRAGRPAVRPLLRRQVGVGGGRGGHGRGYRHGAAPRGRDHARVPQHPYPQRLVPRRPAGHVLQRSARDERGARHRGERPHLRPHGCRDLRVDRRAAARRDGRSRAGTGSEAQQREEVPRRGVLLPRGHGVCTAGYGKSQPRHPRFVEGDHLRQRLPVGRCGGCRDHRRIASGERYLAMSGRRDLSLVVV